MADAQASLPPDGYSLALCETIAAIQPSDVPAAVRQATVDLVLDTTGVMLGARRAPGIDIVLQRYTRWELSGTATAVLTGQRLSPPSAALLNATAAHALDFDDQHDRARVHTFCVLLPTLMAVVQQMAADGQAVSGERFVHALVIGSELNARLGVACQDSLAHGWHPTMVFGTLSSAVAAAWLLGLPPEGMRSAMGNALHQAAGTAQAARDGVLAKRVGAGFAARSAVTAAYLAADGITGVQRVLEGTAGLFSLYERGKVDASVVSDGWGQRWFAGEYSIKPYPCCRCNHTVIDLGLQLRAEGLRAEDVAEASLSMCELNRVTVGQPYENEDGDVVRAQFSASYGFAVALAEGVPSLANYRAPVRPPDSVLALAQRTEVRAEPAFSSNDIEPASVRLTLRDGSVVERSTGVVSGSPDAPLDAQRLAGKFDDCLVTGFGATAQQARALRERLAGVAKWKDVADGLEQAFGVLRH